MVKKVSKKEYEEYLYLNPRATIQNIADHFELKKSTVVSQLAQHQIKLNKYKSISYHGIQTSDIVEYAANHTMNEILTHFNEGMPLQSFIWRKKIPYIKVGSRKIKPKGDVYGMMYLLSQTYSLASIGRVFGLSRERVRQVVNGFKSGKIELPDYEHIRELKEDENEETY